MFLNLSFILRNNVDTNLVTFSFVKLKVNKSVYPDNLTVRQFPFLYTLGTLFHFPFCQVVKNVSFSLTQRHRYDCLLLYEQSFNETVELDFLTPGQLDLHPFF